MENKPDPDVELTPSDVICKALKPEFLGPDAPPKEIRKWIRWTFPYIQLEKENEDFEALVEEVRHEVKKGERIC